MRRSHSPSYGLSSGWLKEDWDRRIWWQNYKTDGQSASLILRLVATDKDVPLCVM